MTYHQIFCERLSSFPFDASIVFNPLPVLRYILSAVLDTKPILRVVEFDHGEIIEPFETIFAKGG